MADDPREVLKAAGVECAEVDAWKKAITYWSADDKHLWRDAESLGAAAIIALARLVAEYKAEADERDRIMEDALGVRQLTAEEMDHE